jgi:hypothetical protein
MYYDPRSFFTEEELMFQKIDLWIIENICESIAWWFEYRTGRIGMWIGYQCVMLALALATVLLVFDQKYSIVPITIFLFVINHYAVTFFREKFERGKNVVNPLRHGTYNVLTRTFLLFWFACIQFANTYLVFSSETTAHESFTGYDLVQFLVLVHIYFMACNKMPPGYEEKQPQQAFQ